MDLKNLPKSYQDIYTLDTICDPNIMTLAQAVLEIFCPQASYIGLLLEKNGKRIRKFYKKLIRSSTF